MPTLLECNLCVKLLPTTDLFFQLTPTLSQNNKPHGPPVSTMMMPRSHTHTKKTSPPLASSRLVGTSKIAHNFARISLSNRNSTHASRTTLSACACVSSQNLIWRDLALAEIEKNEERAGSRNQILTDRTSVLERSFTSKCPIKVRDHPIHLTLQSQPLSPSSH